MMVINKPAWTFGELTNFKKAMDLVIKYCDEIKENTKVKAFPVVGIHPMEYRKLLENGKTYIEALNMVEDGLKYAGKLIKDQKAIAIGEIGRPHFPIEDKELEYHNKIIKYCLNLGKDLDCPVVIHAEAFNELKYKELAQMAD
ncbi:TatD family hydrolase [Methanobrevibacter sp. 87.7]|uniref:TatD family hydrolase n=1 Tax=Methanobrevibacter sp. 87.7 TaxID=387957 RepID=UPI000B512301|nr:TatD family hydrolase [Methanobrevibacter sp. 87.7]